MKKCFGLTFLLSTITYSSCVFAAPTNPNAIKIDGSSTVFPITEAVAEEFGAENPEARITVGVSGTGGGFKKFCSGEIQIVDASRPIKDTEAQACKQAGIEFVELPVAYDALTVVVNKQNSWAKSITVAELKKIWEPEAQGKILKWNQVRPSWPDQPLKLYGPGVDSGTFDYFTEAIVGQAQKSRGDFTSSEDDNVLVQGVSSDINALGFFGFAYYEENIDKLNALAIDDLKDNNGAGPQLPTLAGVESGSYAPLARPLYIYVNRNELKIPIVKSFVAYYLKNTAELAADVGYIKLPDALSATAQSRLSEALSKLA